MSFAEYGLSIFFAERANPKLPVSQGDELPEKYSGCRLKMQDSCSDVRAWGLNQSDYCRYFRELTEREPSSEKIVPSEHTVNTVESTTGKELEILRQELARYKLLKLTPEQKKQLGQSDLWEVFTKEGRGLFESFFQQFEKFKGYKEALIERAFPGSLAQIEVTDKNTVKLKESDSENRSWPNGDQLRPENDIETNCTMPRSSSSSVGSDVNRDTDDTTSEHCDNDLNFYNKSKSIPVNDDEDDIDDTNSIEDKQTGFVSHDSEHGRVTDMRSRMIALENYLSEREAEIEEYNDLNMKLKSMLKNRDNQLNNLHEKFARTESQLRKIVSEHDFEVNELKMKLTDGKNLIDQLKRKLEEQRSQSCIQLKKIESLEYHTTSLESLRNERDRLARKLDEVKKNVTGTEVQESIETWICERKALIDENKCLELQSSEQEEEIHRLSKLINYIQNQNDSQCSKMKRTIDDLKAKIDEKDQQIINYEDRLSTLAKESEEKFITYKKSVQRDNISDEDLDQALGTYFKRKVDNVKEFSMDLRDAWNVVENEKIAIENLRKKMTENEGIFQDKIEEKSREVKYYCDKYKECEEIVENQLKEIKQLREDKYACDSHDEVYINDLKKMIQEMELKVTALHEENSVLRDELEISKCKINESNVEITTLENENGRLSHEIDNINAKLHERDLKIDTLKDENLQIAQTLKDTQSSLATMVTKSQLMKVDDEKLNSLSQLQNEINKADKDKRKLEEAVTDLRIEFEEYQKKNKRLEDNLANNLNQRKLLETKLSTVNEDIKQISEDLKDNNVYSDGNLQHLPKKLNDIFKNLQHRLSADVNIYSEKELINENYTKFENHNNDKNHFELNDEEIDGVNKNKNYRELSLKLNVERMMQENKFEKMMPNKAIYEDHNKILKHLENENGTITYSSNSNYKNNEHNIRITPLKYFNHIDPSLEKNIDDFSNITGHYNNNNNNCHNIIFLPPNGTHGQFKSQQRYTNAELVRSENFSCKQFIRNCSERRNNENY